MTSATALYCRSLEQLLERRAGPIDHRLVEGDALVLAPHPHAEKIACGGLIAAKRYAGHHVDVVVATDGATSHTSTVLTPDELVELRRAEVREATRRRGVAADQLHLLELLDGRLGKYAAPAAQVLESLLPTHQYDQVFLPVPAIKVHALEAYRSQLINFTGWAVHPRDLVDRACSTVEEYFEGVGP